MSIWTVPGIDKEPEINITDWRIFAVKSPYWKNETRHLLGYDTDNREGRISSEIIEHDLIKNQISTRSGRIYNLKERNDGNLNSDVETTFRGWIRLNQITEYKDVTDEYK